MASLPLTTTFLHGVHGHNNKLGCRRTQVSFSCRSISRDGPSSDPPHDREKTQQEKKKDWLVSMGRKVVTEAEKVRESLRPKQKGDWKDLALMSLSFAVYVYISQKIVCAYCAWLAILNHHPQM